MGLTNSYVVEPSGRVTRDTRSGRTYKKPKNLRVCEGEPSGRVEGDTRSGRTRF
jgi:hypothetical protein